MNLNTRIAPSPTGFMHLGTARTAYFNWLVARSTGGKFILRIDDTDKARSNPAYTEDIIKTMKWLGLDYDLTFNQSSRQAAYDAEIDKLVQDRLAVVFPDTSVIMFAPQMPTYWEDEIAGRIPITNDDMDIVRKGIPIRKADGSATYHFASVVDDIHFGITNVIRGVDHITNTSRQIAVYYALKKPLPAYCHIGLIHHNGKKLSKRDGAASMQWYMDKGYDPDAVLNFMARLGWGPFIDDKTTSLLTRDQMLKLFLLGGKMKNSAANMDLVKLDSFDRKYKARKVGGLK